MTLFQIVRKKWDLTCSVCYGIGMFGHIALPFEIGWWFDSDVNGNKHKEIGFSFLCFICHIEYRRWAQ